jgi:hypothetical protein
MTIDTGVFVEDDTGRQQMSRHFFCKRNQVFRITHISPLDASSCMTAALSETPRFETVLSGASYYREYMP